MEPKYQLTSDNTYNPTGRAAAAVRTAQGGKSGMPDHADDGNVPAPGAAKQPSDQHTGGPVMRNDQKSDQFTKEVFDAGRGKPERS